jgi:hypothetical protein
MLLKSHCTLAPIRRAADALDSPQSLPNNAGYGLIFHVGTWKVWMLRSVADRPLARDVLRQVPGEGAVGMRMAQEDGRGMQALCY